LAATDSFLVVICIEGSGTLTDDQGNTLPVRQGETVLVPASARSVSVEPEQGIKFLTSRID
ncbi:MAG: mannose-6-phosphate isomerase, partial [Alistipes sp.]|nr:mannose-6-phosphate isomerase [Alistipes sp.]